MRRPLLAFAAAGALAAGAAFTPATAAPTIDPLAYGFQGEGGLLAPDGDFRAGVVAPTAAQRAGVAALGARAVWHPLGSPKVLTRDDRGFLSGPSDAAPVDAARAFVRAQATLFGLTVEQVDALTVVTDVPLTEGPALRVKLAGQPYPGEDEAPRVITFQQVYGGAPVAYDGLLTVGLDPDNRVAMVSSSVTGETAVTNRVELSPRAAFAAAAKDVRVEHGDITVTDERTAAGATVLREAGNPDNQTVQLKALPTPRDGVRLVHEVVLLQAEAQGPTDFPYAYVVQVDAETGQVLHRSLRLQHADSSGSASTTDAPDTSSAPYWKVFPANPQFPVDGKASPDDRVFWCFVAGPECAETLGERGGTPNVATPRAYDVEITDSGSGGPTFTTRGNNAQTAPSRFSQLTPDVPTPPVSPSRTYDFPFTDQWHTSNCDPASFVSPQRNDIDAATANLFVMHNRMHDWGYYLGWTEENSNLQMENHGSEADTETRENDPEVGNSQSGAVSGGAAFTGRDNANQITLNDGTPGITNQYLWEPLQAGFYAPCVDGAYDMSVVGHEVGHAIQNRMTAGPNSGLSGMQARSMGESWSDLTAIEYLNGYGYIPVEDEDVFAVGPYVTGSKERGIRNYNMSDSPLNYSNLEYDGNGTTSPHADGEIWSATQFQIRQALIAKWQGRFDAKDKALQSACADGLKPTTACPGNRRWIQLIHDGFLLQPSATSMLDSRDAILAADKMRYGGENLELLWSVFAQRGMGADAFVQSNTNLQPDPGFKSPLSSRTARVTFRPVVVGGGALPEEVNVFVGRYEARISPLVVLDGGAPATKPMEPARYELFVQAPGFGHRRMVVTLAPGAQTVELPLRRNLASIANDAKVSGDGGNVELIFDDTEASNGGSVEGAKRNPNEASTVQGKSWTVELAGGSQTIREVQVSTANRPALCSGDLAALGCEASREAPYDTGGQSRFAALRSFEILTCDTATGSECAAEGDFTSRLVAKDAFPAGRPRPLAPDLQLKTFALPETQASHVRLKVIDNQCTGGPLYTGEANPAANPLSNPDCENGFTLAAAPGAPASTVSLSQGKNVRIAELQVFGARSIAAPASAPAPVAVPEAAPAPRAAAPQAGRTLPATGPLPIALPALLLAGIGFVLLRRRTEA